MQQLWRCTICSECKASRQQNEHVTLMLNIEAMRNEL